MMEVSSPPEYARTTFLGFNFAGVAIIAIREISKNVSDKLKNQH
jgi:hypothetical protein